MKKSERIQIEGMSCGHCINAVRAALERTEGVEVEDVEIGAAHVRYDPETTGPKHLVKAIEDEGYTVVVETA